MTQSGQRPGRPVVCRACNGSGEVVRPVHGRGVGVRPTLKARCPSCGGAGSIRTGLGGSGPRRPTPRGGSRAPLVTKD